MANAASIVTPPAPAQFKPLAAAEHSNSLALRDQRLLFANLLPFEWRGIGVPYVHTRIEMRQDLAEHRFVDVDGADVEGTGLQPKRITVRVPFLNNIAPAASETWTSGSLYPNVLRQFWAAMADRSKGTLQHPEFGPFTCVPETFVVDWDAKTRDGVYADATFVESLDSSGQLSINITGAGLVGLATQAGIDLDNLLPSIPLSAFPAWAAIANQTLAQGSFADFARSLQGVADQISLLQYSAAGSINEVVFRVQNVQSAITQALGGMGGQQAATAVQYWPTRMAIDTFTQSIAAVQKQLLAGPRPIGLWFDKQDQSLAMLAQVIPGATIGDLMALNPALLYDIVVPAGTGVRYYLQSPTQNNLPGTVGTKLGS